MALPGRSRNRASNRVSWSSSYVSLSATINHPLSQVVLTDYFIKHFREFIHALASDNPLRRHQGSGGESFAGARDMFDRDVIGARIKPEPVCSRDVTGPRRRDRHVAIQVLGYDFSELQRCARRRVTLPIMMRLFDERIVRLNVLEEFCRGGRDSVKELYAYRKVGAVDQRAVVLSDDALDVIEIVLPAGGADYQRYAGQGASL